MATLLLRFDAPMMSFGAPMVDSLGVIQPYPGLSMLTGLFGNALGWHHRDWEDLEALQRRIDYAVREDIQGVKLRDYQIADLGQPHMLDDLAWTTRGRLERRAGGSSKSTHPRERDYWAQAVYTIGVCLRPGDGPSLRDLHQALVRPARPLFLGRKCCIPSGEIVLGTFEDDSAIEALRRASLHERAPTLTRRAWWCVEEEVNGKDVSSTLVTDARDWRNQVHVGQRWMAHGTIEVTK